jgi:hypothetical protein
MRWPRGFKITVKRFRSSYAAPVFIVILSEDHCEPLERCVAVCRYTAGMRAGFADDDGAGSMLALPDSLFVWARIVQGRRDVHSRLMPAAAKAKIRPAPTNH